MYFSSKLVEHKRSHNICKITTGVNLYIELTHIYTKNQHNSYAENAHLCEKCDLRTPK